jgi:hypothetical protein
MIGSVTTIDMGDLPTWLAAGGTVGALAAAFWQIRAERRARLAREQQDRDDRHREQARLVSAVLGPVERPPSQESGGPSVLRGRTAVDLINSSAELVYRVVAAIVGIQGTLPRTLEAWLEIRQRPRPESEFPDPIPTTTASILPSGTYRVWIRGIGWWGVLSGRGAAEVAFTDRAGTHWIRRANGQLEELPEDPITHYLGLGPHDLQTPERLP